MINPLKKFLDSVQKLLIAKLILTSQNIMMINLEWIKKNYMVKEKDVKISIHLVFNIIKELMNLYQHSINIWKYRMTIQMKIKPGKILIIATKRN